MEQVHRMSIERLTGKSSQKYDYGRSLPGNCGHSLGVELVDEETHRGAQALKDPLPSYS